MQSSKYVHVQICIPGPRREGLEGVQSTTMNMRDHERMLEREARECVKIPRELGGLPVSQAPALSLSCPVHLWSC